MEALRQKQKTERRRRIVESASRLFNESGFNDLKIEDIAEQAEVSVGTIYNYYESKGGVLMAVVSLEVNEVINAGEDILAAPSAPASEAINALFDIYLRHSLHYLSKSMWRAAISMWALHPESRAGRQYAELDEKLCQQVCRLLAVLKSKGFLVTTMDTDLAGRILFNTMNMTFVNFVRDEAMAIEVTIDSVRRQTEMLMCAIRE